MRARVHIRLRRIVWPADFRRSDRTLYESLNQKEVKRMRGSDAVCFVSRTGNQVLFVYRSTHVGIGARGTAKAIITSIRLRLTSGRFTPSMLTTYALDCGLAIEGAKRFEHYVALKQNIAEEAA
jgi:hypothetical protein